MLFESAMDLTDELLSQGNLKDLCVEIRDGISRTQHVSKDRLESEGNLALFGILGLPVISGDTRLAHLILTKYHHKLGPLIANCYSVILLVLVCQKRVLGFKSPLYQY